MTNNQEPRGLSGMPWPLLSPVEHAAVEVMDAERAEILATEKLREASEAYTIATRELHNARRKTREAAAKLAKARKADLDELIKAVCTGNSHYINSTLDRRYE